MTSNIDPEISNQIAAIVALTVKAEIEKNAPAAPNIDELTAGFKAQIDAHVRNLKLEVADIAATINQRCNETDDLVSRLLAQIADLDVRLRKYMDGDRYSITKRQVARLMRENNG